MRIDVLTLFPEAFAGPLQASPLAWGHRAAAIADRDLNPSRGD